MRRLTTLLFGIVVALFAVPAVAADTALREIIGFSEDGRTFAFEEYGVQDGSGFPYSNIYVIDTATNSWVAGTPVRVTIEGEGAPLFETRGEARDRAAPILRARGIEPFPIGMPGRGLLVVTNPITELSADPHRARFSTYPLVQLLEEPLTVVIKEHNAESPLEFCEDFGQTRGFTLTIARGGGAARTIHADSDVLPVSRSCALAYAISDIIYYQPPLGRPAVLAVLISVFRVGFEGQDRRFIAVATTLME